MKSAEDASSEAPKKDKKTTTKSRKANSFYLVVRKVNELFASFDVANQNTENKRAAIDLALGLKKSIILINFVFGKICWMRPRLFWTPGVSMILVAN